MATSVVIKNSNVRNYLKIVSQVPDTNKVGVKVAGKWKDSGADKFVPPGEVAEIWVAAEQRFLIEEMPT